MITQSPSTSRKPKACSDEIIEIACQIKDYHGDYPCISTQGDNYVRLTRPSALNRHNELNQERIYQFDHVFVGSDSQGTVFERYSMDLVEDLVNGRNALLFVYGVDGKTNTMLGNADECRILLRASDVLFNSIPLLTNSFVFYPNGRNGFHIRSEAQAFEEQRKLSPIQQKNWKREREPKAIKFPRNMAVAVFVSYIEICNDQFCDLLDDSLFSEFRSDMSKDLNDSNGHPFVDRLTEIEVQSSDAILTQYLKAQKRRKMAKALSNASNHRSHSIFNIRLVMCEAAPSNDAFGRVHPVEDESKIIVSQLSIVYLADSEKLNDTQNRLTVASKTNEGLLSLRKCFDQLREKERRRINATNVPYRDNKLTHLFKSYFEGNGRIRMIICVNPQPQDFGKNLLAMSFGATSSNANYFGRELEEDSMIADLRSLRIPEFDYDIADLRNKIGAIILKMDQVQHELYVLVSYLSRYRRFDVNLKNDLNAVVGKTMHLRRQVHVLTHHLFRFKRNYFNSRKKKMKCTR